MKAGEAGLLAIGEPPEERLIRLVQAGQHVLEHGDVGGGVVGRVRAQGFQLGFLAVAREGHAALPPQRDALLKRGVIEGATAPQDTLKFPLLGGRRLEFLLVGLAHARLTHGYLTRFRLARYSRNARTISPLRERSFSCADCFMPSATSAGTRRVIRLSSRCVSMTLIWHISGVVISGWYFWLKPEHASPLPLKQRGLRRRRTPPPLQQGVARGRAPAVGHRRSVDLQPEPLASPPLRRAR